MPVRTIDAERAGHAKAHVVELDQQDVRRPNWCLYLKAR
jgi:hypothetical protein